MVQEADVSRNEDTIASHVLYKLKVDEKEGMMLNSRMFPHCNQDVIKGDFIKDSSTAQFDVIRLSLSAATRMGAVLGHVDIQGTYFQSGPICQAIYVRPPRELFAQQGTL